MFIKRKQTSKLDKLINECVIKLDENFEVTDPKYAATLNHLNTLYKLKAEEMPKRVDPNTMLTVAAHLIGIFAIINKEHANVITSKALSFVPKPR